MSKNVGNLIKIIDESLIYLIEPKSPDITHDRPKGEIQPILFMTDAKFHEPIGDFDEYSQLLQEIFQNAIDKNQPIELNPRNSPKTKLTSTSIKLGIRYLIPSKRREEIIGDLEETKNQMVYDSIPKWKIDLVMTWHTLLILLGLIRVKLKDYGNDKRIVHKE